jgi:hypothetical protein
MYHEFNFGDVLESSAEAALQVEDVPPRGAGQGCRFTPELAAAASCSSAA